MGNGTYRVINFLTLAASLFYLCRGLEKFYYGFCQIGKIRAAFVCAGMICTVLALSIKAARFYFVILEKRPGLSEFIRLHVKTTLVNLLLPFKAGEFFRMYCFGRKLENLRTGCLLVLVDRYFDTVPLLLLLLCTAAIGGTRVSGAVWFLGLFIALATCAYLSVPSTCRYLNRFLILNTSSEKGILALECLKRLEAWHSYVQELTKGREAVLVLLSGCAWGAEYAALWCLSEGLEERFSSGDFAAYMNSIFLGEDSFAGGIYIMVSVFLLLVLAIASYSMKILIGSRNLEPADQIHRSDEP